jgi:uncharacterized protein YndB with AHSA1/START domain
MTTEEGLKLTHKRVIAVPRIVAFRALTDPRELAAWWGPQGFSIPWLKSDLRPGGSYRIEMQPPEGESFYLQGEFLEVSPPQLVSYTFRWEEPDPEDRETRVVISLCEVDGGRTELTIEQGGFTSERRRALHQEGWSQALDKLTALVCSRGQQPA